MSSAPSHLEIAPSEGVRDYAIDLASTEDLDQVFYTFRVRLEPNMRFGISRSEVPGVQDVIISESDDVVGLCSANEEERKVIVEVRYQQGIT
jgi:hypothetical protein